LWHFLDQRAGHAQRIGESLSFERDLRLQQAFFQSSGATRLENFFDLGRHVGSQFARASFGRCALARGATGALGGRLCRSSNGTFVDPDLGFALDSRLLDVLASLSATTGPHCGATTFGFVLGFAFFGANDSRRKTPTGTLRESALPGIAAVVTSITTPIITSIITSIIGAPSGTTGRPRRWTTRAETTIVAFVGTTSLTALATATLVTDAVITTTLIVAPVRSRRASSRPRSTGTGSSRTGVARS